VKGVSGSRHWWQKKRWWFAAMTVTSVIAVAISSNWHRAQAIERLRAEMRERALKGPQPEPSPPCTTAVNMGEVICGKPAALISCQAKSFIDPFNAWADIRGQDALKAFTTRKYRELGSIEALAQWFACQGFKVSNTDNEVQAYIRTKDGYGPFNAHGLPVPIGWADNASIVLRNGQLRMDIGTTVE
jgi:hypothetical protein